MNLRQNEKYNSLIIDSITDIVSLFEITPDLNFRFLKVNDNFLKTVKLKSEQVIGKLLPEVLPNRVTELINNYLTAIRLGKPISYEEVNENGTFQTSVNPVFNYRGKCTHVIVSAQNVSAKKQADEIIIFQASLLEQVRSVIIATDIAGNIVYWNKFAETFYQWKANEVFGKKLTEVHIPPVREKEVKNNIAIVLKEGYWEGETINKTKDGREVIMHNVLTLITDKKGKPVGIIGISNDISEKKQLENQIARLDRLNMIGEMAAGIGHEVRNPMTTIRGFLQLLTEKEDNHQKRAYFNVMIKEIDRANSIITEYLSLAKNKMIHPKLQNLNTIITNLMPLLKADAAILDKHIIDELDEIPDLYLDEREIIQLILNLVRNGLEAMPLSGRVIIRTFQTEENVMLAVQDEGEGIAPEVLEKLGTPFITTKEQGTGLGLAVCYSIVARQKAKIEVQTSSAGTIFFVKFRQTDLNG
jgi:PAS domain S-box-containing protein